MIDKNYENMTWQEIVKFGMEVIADGCDRNKSFKNCDICPFVDYCNIIQIGAKAGYEVEIPEGWEY